MAKYEYSTDTIAAIATPSGRGGVGIVRVSGPHVIVVAQQLLGKLPHPRCADYLPFKHGDEVIDMGLALYFPKPHSFTGEDVLELHGHGGPVVMDMLLNAVLSTGVRPARPGEFSERAYFNDKLDLAQAEAIADLIDSASQQAARMALRSLQGEFSQRIHSLQSRLTDLRVHVESAIDFPEEEIDFLADKAISEKINDVIQAVSETLAAAKQGNLLKEGMVVVIAGRPNSGKSTLLNNLTGQDTAIVTNIPGTTRDVLRANIDLDGLPLHLIDTAGLRESGDQVEQEGIRRAWKEIQQADQIIYVVDVRQGLNDEDWVHLEKLGKAGPKVILVHNKMDLCDEDQLKKQMESEANLTQFGISAKLGTGISDLKTHLKACVGFQAAGEGQFIARRRHVNALQVALDQIVSGKTQLQMHQAGELLAEELRRAQQSLSEITGEYRADDLLGEIFSSFCIGK